MKLLILALTIFFSSISLGQNQQLNTFLKSTDLFLKMYVYEGRVDYQMVKRNQSQIDSLINTIKLIDYQKLNEQDRKAYLINVYNIFVIKQVSENYPTSSPLDIDGFFKKTTFSVYQDSYTLNALEDYLRDEYKDARIHFVLVCAGIGCPPIINKAYTPKKLEQQLETQTKKSLNNLSFIKINHSKKKVEVSEIFKWYVKDFKPGIKEFINKYRDTNLPSSYKIAFYPYDWLLNNYNKNKKDPKKESNLTEYTPSKLMKKGKLDFKVFNNLYTQTKFADGQGTIIKNQPRSTFFTSTMEFYFGVSKNARVNLGTVLNYRSNRGNNDNMFQVFQFKTKQEKGIGISRSGLSNIGLSLKVMPFKKITNLSIQSTFFVPIFMDKSSSFYLDKRSYIWENRIFYDKFFFYDKFQLFTEFDAIFHIGESQNQAAGNENSGERYANNSVATPLSVFISYFPSPTFSAYVFGQQYQLLPIQKNGPFQEYTQTGLGLKYQVTPQLNIELSTSTFLRGHSSGLGNTYNLGMRFIP